MKKVGRKIVWFALPFLIGVIALMQLPVDESFRWQFISEDCQGRGPWLESVLRSDFEPHTIFLGTSHTINGVKDLHLSNALKIPVLNAGYCRFGRDMHWIIAEEFVRKKPIKRIIVEVRAEESRRSHPMFGYVAQPTDRPTGWSMVHSSYLEDLYHGWVVRMESLRDIYQKQESPALYSPGFGKIPHFADSAMLAGIDNKGIVPYPSASLSDFRYRLSAHYLERIIALCRQRNIDLCWLYLPSYGRRNHLPALRKDYENVGRLLLPPAAILNDARHWNDGEHLNLEGATSLSNWLSKVLSQDN